MLLAEHHDLPPLFNVEHSNVDGVDLFSEHVWQYSLTISIVGIYAIMAFGVPGRDSSQN